VEKWRKVGDIALGRGSFSMAEECYKKSNDFNSLLLFYTSYGDREGLQHVVEIAEEAGKFNVAFEASFNLGNAEKCIEILVKSNRSPEAALFAHAYCPSMLPNLTTAWAKHLQTMKLPFSPVDVTKEADFAFEEKVAMEHKLMEVNAEQGLRVGTEYEQAKKEYFGLAM
jgi:hypothetical protein